MDKNQEQTTGRSTDAAKQFNLTEEIFSLLGKEHLHQFEIEDALCARHEDSWRRETVATEIRSLKKSGLIEPCEVWRANSDPFAPLRPTAKYRESLAKAEGRN